jgi:SAM-dependent methyltransferase
LNALYDRIGIGYRNYRQPDPRIATAINAALGDCRTVLNVGAGAGSYEPTDRVVQALEISGEMIAQRPPHAAPCIQGSAIDLPFDDNSFDAALAILTVHHWPDQLKGLQEMRRVARRRCVCLTWEASKLRPPFWLMEYFPEILERDSKTFSFAPFQTAFGKFTAQPVMIPQDCTDGFLACYWKRPEMYLDPGARRAISSFAYTTDTEAKLERLRRDIADGTWMAKNGYLMDKTEMDFGYRLVIADV